MGNSRQGAVQQERSSQTKPNRSGEAQRQECGGEAPFAGGRETSPQRSVTDRQVRA